MGADVRRCTCPSTDPDASAPHEVGCPLDTLGRDYAERNRRAFARALAQPLNLDAITPAPYLVDGDDPLPRDVTLLLGELDAERAEDAVEFERHRAMHEDTHDCGCNWRPE